MADIKILDLEALEPDSPVSRIVGRDLEYEVNAITWSASGHQILAAGLDRDGTFTAEVFDFHEEGAHATLISRWKSRSSVHLPLWLKSSSNQLVVQENHQLVCLNTSDWSEIWRTDLSVDAESEGDTYLGAYASQRMACVRYGDECKIVLLYAGNFYVVSQDGTLDHVAPSSRIYSVAALQQGPVVVGQREDDGAFLRMNLKRTRKWTRIPATSQIGRGGGFSALSYWQVWSRADAFVAHATGEGATAISLQDGKSLRLLATLEGHSGDVFALDFSSDDALLASMANDGHIRLWRTDTWQCLTAIDCDSSWGVGGISFHPTLPLLACRNNDNSELVVLRCDMEALLRTPVPVRRYINAKVVLVGDTGVGKSGLGLVLSGQDYKATESTHGRKVASAGLEERLTPDGAVETRETMLWDLAGQPGYRLVHQLHLAQSAMAIVVFDSRSESDPIAGVTYWHRAIQNSSQYRSDGLSSLPTVLAAARVDRGGVPLPHQRIAALVEEMRLLGYVETSAKEGWGIDELRQLIHGSIPWDDLPWSASTELFDSIKAFLWREKNAGLVLVVEDDLMRRFTNQYRESANVEGLRASFATCIRLLEARDVLRKLTFGNYVLLQPEALDAYASAMIDAARTEPDGLGFVTESAALEGSFRMSSDERLDDKNEERLLLIATVEELLRHDLALREVADGAVDLIFPSQFTRDRPDSVDSPRLDLVFSFEGPVHSIYAALAVRLSHVTIYSRREMYRNTALFEAKVGGTCGISLRATDEGAAELGLFFREPASEETRFLFEDYVYAHLMARAIPDSVKRRRVYYCLNVSCQYEFPTELVSRWIQRGRVSARCPACEESEISLLDREERLTSRTHERVSSMNHGADEQRDLAVAETTIKGKAATGTFDVFVSYRYDDREEAVEIARRLLRRGIRPWLDLWEIAPGQRWQDVLEAQIESIRSVAVLIGSGGLGPWQDLETKAFVNEFMRRGCTVIPVFLSYSGADASLPVFLAEWQAADFRYARPDPLERLVWGIQGR
jgi:GTPase SAR1 family protein/outer membrane protein assembly factor BamB